VANKRRRSKVVLSPAARRDLRDALIWSETRFGPDARLRYEVLIMQAIRDIGSEPTRPGSIERPELMKKGARTYHIRFSRERAKTVIGVVHDPRHFIVYRQREDESVTDIARILHDCRDLDRHIPEDFRRMGTEDPPA
jgi:toxin ParE1/3/4